MSQISQDSWEQWLLHWWQPQTKQNQIGKQNLRPWVKLHLDILNAAGWARLCRGCVDLLSCSWWAPSSPWDNGLVFSGDEQAAPSLAGSACIPSCFSVTWESCCLLCTLNFSFPALCFIPGSVRPAKCLKRCRDKKSVPFLVVGWVWWYSGINKFSRHVQLYFSIRIIFCGMEFLFLQLFYCLN